jgi:chromosome segregation ATPase
MSTGSSEQDIARLGAEQSDARMELLAVQGELRHQQSVFDTLELLKKEHDFLRGLIGSMLDEGLQAREQIEQLREESQSLLARKLEIEGTLASKREEVNSLDQAILDKSRTLAGEPGV